MSWGRTERRQRWRRLGIGPAAHEGARKLFSKATLTNEGVGGSEREESSLAHNKYFPQLSASFFRRGLLFHLVADNTLCHLSSPAPAAPTFPPAMPRSKRNTVVALTKTDKKDKAHKGELINTIREQAEAFNYVWVFDVEHMRNNILQEVRAAWKGSRWVLV